MSNDIASNRSTFKEFLASIATISGDLSNITAPPFVLGEFSTVEIPQYWADKPLLFVAPSAEEDAQKRALLVLKWFLGSLRNQQYAGRKEDEGVKKPLNAFLGELFLGSWNDEELGETNLVSEQVSHHPPITACYLWNDKHGIRAEGFTQQEITFSGSVNIKQKGYAVLHIDKYKEDYLIPVPNVKVKGILSGVPYPELHGEYSLISSNGYVSHIKFEGKGFFGSGHKNGFEARMFHVDQPREDIYTIKGSWSGVFMIIDAKTAEETEKIDVMSIPSLKMNVPELAEQDPWESRKAWGNVIAALRRSDMKGTTNSKSVIEEGQRQMRKNEKVNDRQWKNIFFQIVNQDPVFESLSTHDSGSFTLDPQGGIWKVNQEAIRVAKKPYHGDLLPSNQNTEGATSKEARHSEDGHDQTQIEAAAVAVPSEVSKEAQDGFQAPSQNTNIVGTSNDASRHGNDPVPHERHASTASEELRAMGEPTDVQVEAFLRAKHSNAK
ncbi:hypothetical protein BKA66DRAFT_407522 [Pyrenochaeta sp. MPI-SDFR-AT-0127]|nr:hypothetical protein BKA66DRAFT_407522 [Pyrenochaeta sp. MPI-SDFR-AT-0127]